MNGNEPPTDGGTDAVDKQEPLADGRGAAVNGNDLHPGDAPASRPDETKRHSGEAEPGHEPAPAGDEPDEDQRLAALLRDLVSGDRKMKTAGYLGVSYRTLDRALETGVLLPRIRDALKRRMLEEGGETGLRHRARVETLERRAEAMDERVAAIEQARERAEEATSAAVGELARRVEDGSATVEALASRLARLEQRQVLSDHGIATTGSGEGGPVAGRRGVVTPEPHPGEAQSYGAGMALVEEWRALVRRRGDGSRTEQARRRERVMELEIALIGEHGLALPPNTEPLHPSERERYLGWRRRELADLRGERRRRVALRWVRRVLTFGVWRR